MPYRYSGKTMMNCFGCRMRPVYETDMNQSATERDTSLTSNERMDF